MRPTSDVAKAVLKAARSLHLPRRAATATEAEQPEQGATERELREIVMRAGVGERAARWTIQNMKARGDLHFVGHRRVDYHNKMERKEFAPRPMVVGEDEAEEDDAAKLDSCIAAWVR